MTSWFAFESYVTRRMMHFLAKMRLVQKQLVKWSKRLFKTPKTVRTRAGMTQETDTTVRPKGPDGRDSV